MEICIKPFKETTNLSMASQAFIQPLKDTIQFAQFSSLLFAILFKLTSAEHSSNNGKFKLLKKPHSMEIF